MARQPKNRESSVKGEDSEDIVRKVAAKLQAARQQAGISQTALAEMAGLSQNYIYEVEYGTSNFTVRTLAQITDALKIDIRDVFPGSPMAPPSATEVKRLARALENIVTIVKQHMADELELLEQDAKRRAKDKALILGALNSIAQLGLDVGSLVGAPKEK